MLCDNYPYRNQIIQCFDCGAMFREYKKKPESPLIVMYVQPVGRIRNTATPKQEGKQENGRLKWGYIFNRLKNPVL